MSAANGWLLVWVTSLPTVWQVVFWTTLGLLFVGGIIILMMVFGLYHIIHWDKQS